MTVALCKKTCAKGVGHWLWFYLPTLTLVAVSLFLYLVFLALYLLPAVSKYGMAANLGVIIAFHILFGMYWLCLGLTWAVNAGRLQPVRVVCGPNRFPQTAAFGARVPRSCALTVCLCWRAGASDLAKEPVRVCRGRDQAADPCHEGCLSQDQGHFVSQ